MEEVEEEEEDHIYECLLLFFQNKQNKIFKILLTDS
jgi:hypothetical protein